MNRLRDDFLPIPDWPDYPINRFGQVRGRCGLLSCDTKGRVCIRSKAAKRQDALHVGELMEMTGVLVNPDDAPAAPSDVPTELEEKLLSLSYERDTLERQVNGMHSQLAAASETIDRGRRINAHRLFLVRQHQGFNPQSPIRRLAHSRRIGSVRVISYSPSNQTLVFPEGKVFKP